MTMQGTRVPALIVGAGAAGIATSALLAKHGVRSLLVEKRREVFLYPKARNLSFRTLEILRGLGLSDEVHAVADGVSDIFVKPALNSSEEAPAIDIDAIFAPFGALTPEPPAQYCPQSRLEPMLLAETRRRGSEVRYGTEVLSFEQDGYGVTVVVRERDSEKTETVRADYLVAADGVHSPIRGALGVTTSGCGALPIFVIFVYFKAPWRQFVPNLGDGDGVQVKNAAVDGIVLAVEGDLGMFITTYLPGKGESAEQFTPERCAELLTAAFGERIDTQVIEVASWQPYELVADQFQCGRIFLVGDAAHTMPPFKAGGANTAIQSADNLAWKLAAVLNDQAGPALLSSYQAERHPVGRFNARQSLTGPSLAMLRLDDDRPHLPPDEEAPMFALLAGYQYRSAAVISDERPPTDPDAVSLVDELRGQPGTRVPHVWVRHHGERVSTLDLLGPEFTLLSGDERWRSAVTWVSAALNVPITVACIGDEAWAAATGVASGGALLVRPDAFVGWRVDGLPEDPESQLRQALSQILGRRPAVSEQENLATVRAWVEAINRNDVDAELACWASDGEFTVVPTGVTYRGREQIRLAGQQSASVIAGQPIEARKRITHLEAGEQWACVSYEVHATIRGPVALDGIMVIPEGSERTVMGKSHVVFEMRQGKLGRGLEYVDPAAMAEQLGIDRSLLARLYSSLGSPTDFSSTGQRARSPVEVATRFFEAWNAKDVDGLAAVLAPQVSGRNPVFGEVTLSREAMRNAIRQNMAVFPDLHMEIESMVCDGGVVAIEEIETATLAATGATYRMAVSCVLRVNADGQITDIHNYWDTDTYFRQLNVTREDLPQIAGHAAGADHGS